MSVAETSSLQIQKPLFDQHGGETSESVRCKCLNIRFYLSSLVEESDCVGQSSAFDSQTESLGTECNGRDSSYHNISSLLVSPRFVKSDIASQAHHGATAKLMYLIETKHAGHWNMFRCFNCNTLTHVSCMNEPYTVLVNVGEMLNQQEQESIIASNPNYSKLFGFVCSPVERSRSTPTKSSLKPSVMNYVREIKDSVSDYLDREKSKMNDKVREYEKALMTEYLDVERSAWAHQQALENRIRIVYGDSTEDEDSAFERSVEEISLDSAISRAAEQVERARSAVDDMFELDPFTYEEGDAPDDDDIFDDDADDTPNYRTRGDNAEVVDGLAKSVPIPIMRQMRGSTSGAKHSHSPNEDLPANGSFDGDERTPGPENMEASINALARSVGYDGTEIFGDLPRPRFNTGTRNPRGRSYY